MSRGDRRADPLGAPVAPGLISGEPWYSTTSKDYFHPSIVGRVTEPIPVPAPAPKRERAGRHRKPARRVNPRYLTAAVFTGLLAVPVLWMASELATHSPVVYQNTPAITQTAHLPVTIYSGGHKAMGQICVIMDERGGSWTAWATNRPC